MSPDPEDARSPLDLAAVGEAALQLAAERDLAPAIRRFLDTIRAWSCPSAVLAAVRDASCEQGWRLLPELCHGSAALGAERWVAKLVEDSPGCLARTTVLAGQDVAGARVRDNWVVPWSCGGDSGLLLLRGVPRPQPANLGQGLALVAAPLWPRLLGSPAERVERLVREVQGASSRLAAEAARQAERLEAARAASGEAIAGALEAAHDALASAQQQRALLEQDLAERDEARAAAEQRAADAAVRIEQLQEALARAEEQREQALQQAEAAREQALQAAQQAGEARQRAEQEAAALRQERDDAVEAVLVSRGQTEEAQRAAAELTERLEAAEEAQAEAVAEHAALRQALDAERLDLGRLERELAEAHRERSSLQQAHERALHAQQSARGSAESELRLEGLGSAARGALDTARRSAFVPAGLRLALDDLAGALGPAPDHAPPRVRIAILDRDLGGLGPLALELEAAGVEARIANYPEELALLLKTPAGRDVAVVVCDVMAFRPEQNPAALLNGWERDRPGLAFVATSASESAVEAERLRRVPAGLLAAQVPRPLSAARLLEAVDALLHRTAKP